ncbi:hypothetical protein KW456_14870 [Vibrio fluvialis]|nr:hypothetical protein [Vibrio fluvialis]
MKIKIKEIVQKNSKYLKFLKYVPFKFRLGKHYKIHCDLIIEYQKYSNSEKERFHFEKLSEIVNYVYHNNEFYRQFYDKNNFHPSMFRTLNDFNKVPIVTKEDLKLYSIFERSEKRAGDLLVNTGGTSGEPLAFYLDKYAFAREWAYMHEIWGKLSYSPTDLKLTFRGKKNKFSALEYNVIHNEYVVDAYLPFDDVITEIKNLVKVEKIKYIHGYPSSIYEFCRHCLKENIDVCSLFNGEVKGVFLGSEFPLPKFRNLIETSFKAPSISWYGHSEMAVLAYEKNLSFVYSPFQTYGFVESAPFESDNNKLIATSYYNKSSPFIRYDTGDLIKDEVFNNKILESFKISSGRNGDFIEDASGKLISLTALIFGRHHAAFENADFIQVYQSKPGHITIYLTSRDDISVSMFDFNGVNISFEIIMLESPFKTKAGKVPLKLNKSLISG